jgi:hypothetical protein
MPTGAPLIALDQSFRLGAEPFRRSGNKLPGTGFWLPRTFYEICGPMISGSASSAEKFVRSKNNVGSAWTA